MCVVECAVICASIVLFRVYVSFRCLQFRPVPLIRNGVKCGCFFLTCEKYFGKSTENIIKVCIHLLHYKSSQRRPVRTQISHNLHPFLLLQPYPFVLLVNLKLHDFLCNLLMLTAGPKKPLYHKEEVSCIASKASRGILIV